MHLNKNYKGFRMIKTLLVLYIYKYISYLIANVFINIFIKYYIKR